MSERVSDSLVMQMLMLLSERVYVASGDGKLKVDKLMSLEKASPHLALEA